MNNKTTIGLLAFGLLVGTTGDGFASGSVDAGGPIGVDFSVDVASKYVWRGYVIADKWTVQPTTTFSFAQTGVSLNVWGSFTMQERDDFKAADELDFTLDYSQEVSAFGRPGGVSVGLIQYTFPNAPKTADTSEEVYAAYHMDAPLQPSVAFYYDFGLVDGWFTHLHVGHSVGVGPKQATELSAGASLAFSDWTGSAGFHDVTFTAGASHPLGSRVSVRPGLGLSIPTEEIRHHGDKSDFWASVGLDIAIN